MKEFLKWLIPGVIFIVTTYIGFKYGQDSSEIGLWSICLIWIFSAFFFIWYGLKALDNTTKERGPNE